MNKLRNYNFSKDELADCYNEINKHNMASLVIVTLANAILALLLSFYSKSDTGIRSFYYAACAAEIAAFFFSLYMYKKSSLSAISFKIGFTFFVF
ncbi:MAG: hypothetical protein LBH50_02565, partial [Spirochaetaceae bacterium]|nr:hypothetical protein [Spirochaetaceae bacterium]